MRHARSHTTVSGRDVPGNRDRNETQRQKAGRQLQGGGEPIGRCRVAELSRQVGIALQRDRGAFEEVEPDLLRGNEERQQRGESVEPQCPLRLALAMGARREVRLQSRFLLGIETRSLALVDRRDRIATDRWQSCHFRVRDAEGISGATHQRIDCSGRRLQGIGHVDGRLVVQLAQDEGGAVARAKTPQSHEHVAGVIATESFVSSICIRGPDCPLDRLAIGGIRRTRALSKSVDRHVASDSEEPGPRLLDTLARRIEEANEHLLRSVCGGLRFHQASETVTVDALAVPAIDLGEGDRVATQGEREHFIVIPTTKPDPRECQ